MLDLTAIKARAAARLALPPHSATLANLANPANEANAQPVEAVSQLATLATPSGCDARPFKLTLIQGGLAHAEPWDEAAMARFEARTGHLRQQGLSEQNADDLAERLHLRDVHADYRHLCLECRHYRPGRCGNHAHAALASTAVSRELATNFQDCAGFASVETSEGQR